MRLKLVILAILFLLFSAVSVNARPNMVMSIEGVNRIYFIDQAIEPTVTILSNITTQAILSAELGCEEYEIEYFMQPVNLKESKKLTIDIKPLKTFDRMKGTCIINFYVHSMLDGELSRTWTDAIQVKGEENETEVEDETEEAVKEETAEEEVVEVLVEEDVEKEPKKRNWLGYLIFILVLGILYYFYKKNEPRIKRAIRDIRMWGFR